MLLGRDNKKLANEVQKKLKPMRGKNEDILRQVGKWEKIRKIQCQYKAENVTKYFKISEVFFLCPY